MTCTPHDVIPSIMYIIILYQWHNEPNMGGGGGSHKSETS